MIYAIDHDHSGSNGKAKPTQVLRPLPGLVRLSRAIDAAAAVSTPTTAASPAPSNRSEHADHNSRRNLQAHQPRHRASRPRTARAAGVEGRWEGGGQEIVTSGAFADWRTRRSIAGYYRHFFAFSNHLQVLLGQIVLLRLWIDPTPAHRPRAAHKGDQSMIHNLKVLIAAAMVLMAFGALSATAHAAEEKFHCSVEPCTLTLAPDETAGTTTAHHVFVVKGTTAAGAEGLSSITWDQLTGEATSITKTPTELTFVNLTYENSAKEMKCKIGGSETVEINVTTCDYRLTSAGGNTPAGSELHVLCSTAGDAIDFNIKGTLCLQITPFTALGIGYHTIGFQPNRRMTATVKVTIPKGGSRFEKRWQRKLCGAWTICCPPHGIRHRQYSY